MSQNCHVLTACVTKVVCGISDGDIPIGGINTVPISLPLTLKLWGVTDVRQQHSIRNSVRQICERLMLELLRQEAQLTSEQRGGHGCQTDLLGTFYLSHRCFQLTLKMYLFPTKTLSTQVGL